MRRVFIVVCIICCIFLYIILPEEKRSNKDFNIKTYTSIKDADKDSIDDQTDIYLSVLDYIDTKPKYRSKYYSDGFSNDEYGVCTDVIAFALLGAGYNLMELVNDDILKNTSSYNIDKIDKNIDFRRVENLFIYFNNTATSLTTDTRIIRCWQAGDIVVFKNHIGIISANRNKNGVPYVIHHYSSYQKNYEEDILEKRKDIIGHFRIK